MEQCVVASSGEDVTWNDAPSIATDRDQKLANEVFLGHADMIESRQRA